MFRRKRSRSRSPGRQEHRNTFSRNNAPPPYARENPSRVPRRPSSPSLAPPSREESRTSQKRDFSPRRSREDPHQQHRRSPRHHDGDEKNGLLSRQNEPHNSDDTKRHLWASLTAQLAKQGLLPLSHIPHSALPGASSPLLPFMTSSNDCSRPQHSSVGQPLLPSPHSVETRASPSSRSRAPQFPFTGPQSFVPCPDSFGEATIPQPPAAVLLSMPVSVPTPQQSSSIFLTQGSKTSHSDSMPTIESALVVPSLHVVSSQHQTPTPPTALPTVCSTFLPAFEMLDTSPLPPLADAEFEDSDIGSDAGGKPLSGSLRHNRNRQMTEVDQKLLQDYVAKEVVSELTPYLRKNWISSKDEFKALARKLTRDIVAVEHAKNVHNGKTAAKIKEFVSRHMRRARKKVADANSAAPENVGGQELDLK
eukprot:RCo034678